VNPVVEPVITGIIATVGFVAQSSVNKPVDTKAGAVRSEAILIVALVVQPFTADIDNAVCVPGESVL
jgi:hypothetical protein